MSELKINIHIISAHKPKYLTECFPTTRPATPASPTELDVLKEMWHSHQFSKQVLCHTTFFFEKESIQN